MRIKIDMYVSKKDRQAENIILNAIPYKYEAAHKACEYARHVLMKPWPKAEKTILQCPRSSYLYARYVLKKRWPEAESIIAKEAYSSYSYSRFVIKGRFKLAENNKAEGSIFNPRWDTNYSFLYAKNISKERLKKSVENKIACSSRNVDYAKTFLKNRRWKMAEKWILDQGYSKIQEYMKILNEKDKKDFHKKILLSAMAKQQSYFNPAKCWIETYGQDFLKENTSGIG
jgi:hypothetical protein